MSEVVRIEQDLSPNIQVSEEEDVRYVTIIQQTDVIVLDKRNIPALIAALKKIGGGE